MRRIVAIIVLLITNLSLAQVEFVAKVSRTKIGVNENVRVDFSMNQDGDNLELPSFDNFKIIGGPYQQISHSFINGKRTYNKSFGFTLQPTKQGVLTIGSATITIAGKTYQSDPVEITVTGPVQRPNDLTAPIMEAGESVHLMAQVSKKTPYLNEPITILYKLYYRDGVGVRDFGVTDNTQYNDFWSHTIDVKQYKTEQETFKGELYNSVVLKQVVLYPQKSGRLTITPLKMDLALDIPTNRRDFFGRRMYTTTTTKVSSGVTTIDVKPLPEQGKPEDFSGAVGVFDFVVHPSKTALRHGESFDLDIIVSGKGNLELFSLPEPVVPSSFEMYDPIAKKQVSISLQGMSGKISDKYTIVPQYQGKYIIKPISFSYFDLVTQSYKTLSSHEITIDMIDGPTLGQDTDEDATLAQSPNQKPTQFTFIELKTQLEPVEKRDFLGSIAFYIWLLLPFIAMPLAILFKRFKDKRDADYKGNKIRSNNKLAKKYLSAAKAAQGDTPRFYQALEKALHNFLKAKLEIETSELSKDNISELLLERGADKESIDAFLQLLATAEMVRYAPSLASSVTDDYQKAVRTITELERKIK